MSCRPPRSEAGAGFHSAAMPYMPMSADRRPEPVSPLSSCTSERECSDNRALSAYSPGKILRNMQVERHRSLGEKCAIEVLIRYPDDLTRLVVEGSEDVRHVDHLAALIHELTCC